MNVQDVITRVKRQFGDESGVQVTDQDIIRWINDAQSEIAQAQDILEVSATSLSVANQGAYPVPSDIIYLRSVYYNGFKVRVVSLQDYDIYVNNYQEDPENPLSGIPEIFYMWADEIKFYPVPAEAGQDIKLYYTQFPANVTSSAGQLTIPLPYHTRVVEYCLQQAYELDENFDASNLKGQQLSNNLTAMAEDQSWTEHTHYPSVTVLPEDAW